MESWIYAINLLAFFLSIIAICVGVAVIVQNIHLKEDFLNRIAEVEATRLEMKVRMDSYLSAVTETQDKLKTALEAVHKLHTQREDDLNPIRDAIAVLQTRTSAMAANQRMR